MAAAPLDVEARRVGIAGVVDCTPDGRLLAVIAGSIALAAIAGRTHPLDVLHYVLPARPARDDVVELGSVH